MNIFFKQPISSYKVQYRKCLSCIYTTEDRISSFRDTCFFCCCSDRLRESSSKNPSWLKSLSALIYYDHKTSKMIRQTGYYEAQFFSFSMPALIERLNNCMVSQSHETIPHHFALAHKSALGRPCKRKPPSIYLKGEAGMIAFHLLRFLNLILRNYWLCVNFIADLFYAVFVLSIFVYNNLNKRRTIKYLNYLTKTDTF